MCVCLFCGQVANKFWMIVYIKSAKLSAGGVNLYIFSAVQIKHKVWVRVLVLKVFSNWTEMRVRDGALTHV